MNTKGHIFPLSFRDVATSVVHWFGTVSSFFGGFFLSWIKKCSKSKRKRERNENSPAGGCEK